MRMARWERLAPLTGVLAVALWLVGAVTFVSNDVDDDATPPQVLRYFEDEGPIYLGSWAWGLGTLFFIWFLGSLRSRLALAEGGPGRLTALAYGGGIAGSVCALGLVAGDLGGVFLAEEENVSPEAAQALHSSTEGFFVLASFPLLAMAAATAIAAFRYGALPKWLGWLTVVQAILLAAYPIVWLSLLFAFPVWLVITSVTLWRQGAAAEQAPTAVTGAPL